MAMSNRARAALEKSIKHWERLAVCSSLEEVYFEGIGPEDCDLCKLYYNYEETINCCYCPIFKKTGKHGCYDTPYDAIAAYEGRNSSKNWNTRTWRKLARAELQFLESLRDDETKS